MGLKTLFWVVVTVELAVLFFYTNAQPVTLSSGRGSRPTWGAGLLTLRLPARLACQPYSLFYRARLLVAEAPLRDPGDRPCRQPSGAVAPGDGRSQRSGSPGEGRQGLAGRMTSPVYVTGDTTDLDRAKAIAARVSIVCGTQARP